MGRSKFPGKPSKHVNKKRVNMLLCTGATKNYVKSVFSDTKQQEAGSGTEVDKTHENEYERLGILLRTNKSSAFLYNYTNFTLKNENLSKVKTMKNKRLIKKPELIAVKKDPVSSNSAPLNRKRIYSEKKVVSAVSPNRDSERTSVAGKFVLPSRSLHSSRVIIPNKRFINHDQIRRTENTKKVVNECPNSASLVTKTLNKKHKLIPTKTQSTSLISDSAMVVKKKHESSDMMLIDSDSNSSAQWSCGKLVLRKARLQLHTQTAQGMDGPFSTCTTASTNLPGTVTCGVCGAVRFYRFVKQARKFNIYSCESCRKFISKMIKRQTCSKTCQLPTLECHKGQGMCHVPPIVRSQQWKLIRCAYKARCPACWLKMCLRSFQMPSNLKISLINMLPENMRSYTDYNITEQLIPPRKLPTPNWQPRTVDTRTKTAMRERTRKFLDSLKVDMLSSKETKHSLPNQQLSSPDSTKRHKLELKGPRVKHVCRSASIVLGQPLATFSQDARVPDPKVEEVCEIGTNSDSYSSSCHSEDDDSKHSTVTTTPDCFPDITETTVTTSKDIVASESCDESNSEPEEAKTSLEPLVTISADYFDTFESDDKVYSNGFGLIGSEPFSVQAVCLNCGSGGREQLIYCVCCCEPYHFYCLDENFLFTYILLNIKKTDSNNDKTDSSWKYLWTCSRCTLCHDCGNEYKTKTICQVCFRYYHTDCSHSKFDHTANSQMICASCFNCDNCGSKDIDKLICNLCSFCYKLKKNTSVCPVCRKRNENDNKVLQCSECKYLVHTACEELSEDMFQILQHPPCSTLFVCRTCSYKKPLNWRDIISVTLKNCYHIVLKSLSKHIKIRKMMHDHRKQINLEKLNQSKVDTISTIDVSKPNEIKPLENHDLSLRKKLCIRECSVNLKNLEPKGKMNRKDAIICNQFDPITLLIVKRKVNSNSYKTIKDFQSDVEQVLHKNDCYELQNLLRNILNQIFHWYDPISSETTEEVDYKSLNNPNTCLDVIKRPNQDVSDTNTVISDNRVCVLCNKISDGLAYLEGRLLYCGLNQWIHVNCAFWSAEVYEEIDCSLRNTGKTIAYSRNIHCDACNQIGASLYCSVVNCDKIVHFPCARNSNYLFRTDKSLFCASHHDYATSNYSTILTTCDFEIHRPVYVEIERTSKLHVELSKIQYLIGGLNVTNLGNFFPQLSDTEEAIIPAEFVSSRLFWSTVKPWKIVKYTITTSIIVPKLENINAEKNFTVDHSLSYNEIDCKINEIQAWNNEVEYLKSGRNNTDDEKIVSQVLDYVLEAICNKEVEDDEPQNTADLLPPDLKDAIFEDLPHDLLDGISMQDIFPKLMSYEDMKNSDTNDCTSVENYDLSSTDRKTDDFWLEPKYMHELNGFVQSTKVSSSINEQKLKRSKSEVFKKLTRTRNHQRSCSLTWSCKLDNTIKKRKICTSKSVTDISSNLYMVLDGTSGDTCDMLQELRLPEGVLMTVDPANADRITDTVRELKYCLEENSVLAEDNEPGKENKFRVWPNRQPSRILQVDGNDDFSSSDSEASLCDVATTDEPVQCDRCQCTYRTLTSYHRHLETCDIITSDSDSEDCGIIETNEYMVNVVENGMHIVNEPFTPHVSTTGFINNDLVQSDTISTAQTIGNTQSYLPNLSTVQSVNTPVQSIINTVPLPANITHMNENIPVISNRVTNSSTKYKPINQQFHNTLPTSQNIQKMVKTTIPKLAQAKPKPKSTVKSRPRPVKAPPKRARKPQQLASASTAPEVHHPTIIIQHLSNANMMPAYVEAFQQQTGQNLQCIATIIPNDKPTSYLTPSSIVPGTFHMQPDPTNYINIPNNNLAMPISQPPQSNIMGTLIQQRPATIHCGTMSTEQLLFSSVPNTIVTDMTGSMYYASEPVYYGYETIVQNTVMSQQFVSTLPGVLESNSSYSATTTQVFQTSKIEPVEVNNGYILVDQSLPQIQSPLIVNTLPVLSQNKTYQPIPEPNYLCNPILPESMIYNTDAKPNVTYMKPQNEMNKFVNLPEPQQTPVVSVAPYVSENGLPMNVVNPMPIVPVSKPTNPVLPMPSIAPIDYQASMNKVLTLEPPNILHKLSDTVEKIQETLTEVDASQSTKNKSDTQLLKLESASLKLIFQKQSNNGVYKISNKYISKNCGPLKIQPKPNKSSKNAENIQVKTPNVPETRPQQPDPNPNILYNIQSQDGFEYSSTSITELWRKVFDAVQEARASHNMPPLSENAFNRLSGLQLLGLNSNGLRYLIEQLPGVGKCIKYTPVCYKKPTKDLPKPQDLIRNSGAARCEPDTITKRPYDMFRWLASKHRNPEYVQQRDESALRRPSSINLPMAMRFRQLKETSKNTVGVYRSNIHGRGLFCLKDIECAEMVIEYAGEVIRSTLTDKREKLYNAKEIGCYMFRVDDNLVIDATMKGNSARFINHSCDPNCYSRVLDILGHKHILIFALRKILQGEELTYDYKFPFEEDKIPCTCGSKKCRKYLN